jgi:hypothetical protein
LRPFCRNGCRDFDTFWGVQTRRGEGNCAPGPSPQGLRPRILRVGTVEISKVLRPFWPDFGCFPGFKALPALFMVLGSRRPPQRGRGGAKQGSAGPGGGCAGEALRTTPLWSPPRRGCAPPYPAPARAPARPVGPPPSREWGPGQRGACRDFEGFWFSAPGAPAMGGAPKRPPRSPRKRFPGADTGGAALRTGPGWDRGEARFSWGAPQRPSHGGAGKRAVPGAEGRGPGSPEAITNDG